MSSLYVGREELDCGSVGSIRDRLSDFNGDRLPYKPEWEAEGNLIYFATSVLVRCNPSPEIERRLTEWLRSQDHDVEPLKRKLPDSETQPVAPVTNILVKVNTDELPGDDVKVEVWIYVVGDRATYDPNSPPDPICRAEVMAFSEIPARVWDICDEDLPCDIYPIVHYFLPRSWFDYAFETTPLTGSQFFGGEHCVVIRTDLDKHPTLLKKKRRRSLWESRWRKAHEISPLSTQDRFSVVSCSDEGALLDCVCSDETMALFLQDCGAINSDDFRTVGEFIDTAVEVQKKSLPMVLWSRAPDCNPQLDDVFPDDLEISMVNFPNHIRQMRRERGGIGANLALVWEDPDILLPPVSPLEAP